MKKQNYRIFIAVTAFVLTLTACSSTNTMTISDIQKPSSSQSIFSKNNFIFHTSEWLAGDDPLNATVEVNRITPQVISAHFKFTQPLDPQKWFNPSMFNHFLFCFGSVHSKNLGYKKWVLGGTDQGEKLAATTTEITIDFAALNDSKAEVTAVR